MKRNRSLSTIKHKTLLNLLSEASDFIFMTRKSNIVIGHSNYAIAKEIISTTKLLKSNLFNYNDVYID